MMAVGGVIHQVEQGRAAGDEAERLVIGARKVGQQIAQVVAGHQPVLVAFLVLEHFQPVQHEQVLARAEHRADDLRPQAGGGHGLRVDPPAAQVFERGLEELVHAAVFVEAPPENPCGRARYCGFRYQVRTTWHLIPGT